MDHSRSDTHLDPTPAPPVDPAGFAPGTVLADRYRIIALAGRGGMGEVYRADDLRLGQPVALKFLPASLECDPAARERLIAEVRSARSVSHPNVCRVYDVGELAGAALSEAFDPVRTRSKGRVFLTMEYIDGEDLASLLRRIGRLPAPKALEVARQLCAGLSAAHDKGVLHRDLKPANVMIDGRGHARITDFGLAVSTGSTPSPGDAAGTFAYMAPERFEGKPATVQSDLYALGLTLYETYTGKPAVKGTTIGEWQRAHSDSTPTSPSALVSEIEPSVERAILRCLEKDPAKRPATAALVAAALPGGDPLAAALAAGETPSPELVAASGEEGTLPRAKAWLWLAACLVAVIVQPFTVMPFNLIERVRFSQSPEVLQARAQEVLQALGYREASADRGWWFRPDDDYLQQVRTRPPSEAIDAIANVVPAPLRFCYRQSPTRWDRTAIRSLMTADDPVPAPGDVYVELDLDGRLLTLRAAPAGDGDASLSRSVDWTALAAAARLGSADAFAPTDPRRWPESAVDVREAREGIYAGLRVRLEAAARGGRTVSFRLLPPWTPSAGSASPAPPYFELTPWVQRLLGWGSLVVPVVLARRNLRLGRGDRPGARRLAVVSGFTTFLLILRASPPLSGLEAGAALGISTGLLAWVCYLGLEPAMRRTFPRLLVALTRLLDGRWRDPLVGQAILAGTLTGLIYGTPGMAAVLRLLDRPGSGGAIFYGSSWIRDVPSFIGSQFAQFYTAASLTFILLTGFLVIRLAVRHAGAAWLGLFLWTMFFLHLGLAEGYRGVLPALAVQAVYTLLMLFVLSRYGALAFAIGWFVSLLVQSAPWTTDLSRWYAGRQWFVAATVVALAVWGFRNVLGRQQAFPGDVLDG